MNSLSVGILYTGGTIGMTHSAQGLQPDNQLARQSRACFSGNLRAEWHVYQPLLDSSAITLTQWRDWLTWVQQHLPRYDALLILHGTDTLAYTASMLALALPNPGKPVIITGAQQPFTAPGSDAPSNLTAAAAACAWPEIQQAAVVFDHHLWRAVGCSKVSTETAAGFSTPHFPPLATWSPHSGWQITAADAGCSPVVSAADPYCRIDPAVRIVSHTLTPGANADMMAQSLREFAADGVILQSYGHGNVPPHHELLSAIADLCRQGIPVLNISQVPQGCTAAVYAAGQALREAGVINGGKANRETALALLTLAAGNHWSHTRIKNCLREWQLLP